MVAFVVGYAPSPIDLIPDFGPVLAYLDELILLPLLLTLALCMVSPAIRAECRECARQRIGAPKPVSRIAAIMIFMIWLLTATAACFRDYDLLRVDHAKT